MCPATHRHESDVPDGRDWGDYTYMWWSRYYGTPNEVPWDYPLLYDRALSNHGERGVNILRVGGDVLWDPDATWLRDFAASHPQYDIPVPN